MFSSQTNAMFGAPQVTGAPQIVMEQVAAPMVMEQTAAPVAYAAAPAIQSVAYAAPAYVETVAAPQITTMAAPMTYAAAAPAVEYIAAPQYTTVQAPVVETIAAPQYTTVAAPVSYAAPVVETMAAPQIVMEQIPQAAPVSYAPVTMQAPSYVAAPVAVQSYVAMPQTQVAATPRMMTTAQAPSAPMKLTEGIPTPQQIAAQKEGYSKALDKQLKEAIETVQKETQIEKEMIKFNAEKAIALSNMQVDEQLVEAMAMADEQATFALLELKKAKVERNLQLDSQASGLVMDYQMKAVQTELAQKQYAFQMELNKKEQGLQAQYDAIAAKANTGTSYTVPAAAVR
jgi:hypothetical protein